MRHTLRRLNVSEIAEACGLAAGTVSLRLNTAGIAPAEVIGKRKLFDTPQALRLLLGNSELDPRAEKGRLDAAKADLAELEVAERRGDLVPRAQLEETLVALCSGVAMRMQSIPSKAGPEVRIADSDVEAEELLRVYINQGLEDLVAAGDDVRRRVEARSGEAGDGARAGRAPASPKANGGRVGGRRAGAVDGERGGAGAVEDVES